jgi:DNA-binding transcriptional regulator YhcF (GntR family)
MQKIKLSKATIRIFSEIVSGNTKLITLAEKLNVSQKTMSKQLNQLDKAGFIKKTKKKTGVIVEISEKDYSLKFKEFLELNKHIDASRIFAGRSLDVLLAITISGKSSKVIGMMLKIQARSVREKIGFLLDRGIVYRKEGIYSINTQIPKLNEFLKSLLIYYDNPGILYWNNQGERLILETKGSLVDGYLTGFSAYKNHGILVRTVNQFYFQGLKKPTLVEIFVHSLFQINDARTLGFTITFFAKNKLYLKKYEEKLLFQVVKYDKKNVLDDIREIYEGFKGNYKQFPRMTFKGLSSVPKISAGTLIKQFELYNVSI